MEKIFCIININGNLWNNDLGWVKVKNVNRLSYYIFTAEEKNKFNLPIGGIWGEIVD